jgi:hypothetical protein
MEFFRPVGLHEVVSSLHHIAAVVYCVSVPLGAKVAREVLSRAIVRRLEMSRGFCDLTSCQLPAYGVEGILTETIA